MGARVDTRVHHVHADAGAVCVAREAGLEQRVADLSRHDLLDLCLERNLGHPQWERGKLQSSLQEYRKQADDFEASLRALRPSPGPVSAQLAQTAKLPNSQTASQPPFPLPCVPQRACAASQFQAHLCAHVVSGCSCSFFKEHDPILSLPGGVWLRDSDMGSSDTSCSTPLCADGLPRSAGTLPLHALYFFLMSVPLALVGR
jgi:hypothetical protein